MDQFSSDIRKFDRILKLIMWTMSVFGIILIRIMLCIFVSSSSVRIGLIFTLIALFLGIGMF